MKSLQLLKNTCHLTRFALPICASGLINMISSFVAMLFVARLGKSELAAGGFNIYSHHDGGWRNILRCQHLNQPTGMLFFYALEQYSRWFILAFAGACVLGSIYGFLQGAWPYYLFFPRQAKRGGKLCSFCDTKRLISILKSPQ